jgi:hypothetical protein
VPNSCFTTGVRLSIPVCFLLLFLLVPSPLIHSSGGVFLEPTGEEWARMTTAERGVAEQRVRQEGSRQRAVSTRYAQDQKEGVCHVHKQKMALRTVDVPVGITGGSAGPAIPRAVMARYLAAAAASFPNAIETVSGSCIPLPGAEKTKEIYVCPLCVEARRKSYKELGVLK